MVRAHVFYLEEPLFEQKFMQVLGPLHLLTRGAAVRWTQKQGIDKCSLYQARNNKEAQSSWDLCSFLLAKETKWRGRSNGCRSTEPWVLAARTLEPETVAFQARVSYPNLTTTDVYMPFNVLHILESLKLKPSHGKRPLRSSILHMLHPLFNY